MTTSKKKVLLITTSIFLTIIFALTIAYYIRLPQTKSPSPSPKLVSIPSAVPIDVMQVDPATSLCQTTFNIPCGSTSPSPSGSISPSPSPSASPSIPPSSQLDCVEKAVYANDSRNRSGFYYLENRIADASTLESGTTIVYNIKVRNVGALSVPEVKITDALSSNLTFLDADSDCTYDSTTRVVTCTIGNLAASSQAQRTLRATINTQSNTSIANSADVYSTNGQREVCSVQLSATGKVLAPSPSPLPSALPQAGVFEVTVGTLGVGILLLILGGVGLLLI